MLEEEEEDGCLAVGGGLGGSYPVSLSREHLEGVGLPKLDEMVEQEGGVGKQNVLIVHAMYHQQSVWPVGVQKGLRSSH